MALLWHSLCFIPRHGLLPRISTLPVQRGVLADRLPVGNVRALRRPDRSAHPEATDVTFRTEAGGYDSSRPPVRAGRKGYLPG